MKDKLILLLVFTYLFLRFCLTQTLDNINPYASYYLEIILVAIAIALKFSTFKNILEVKKKYFFVILLSLVMGFISAALTPFLNISIPFVINEAIPLCFLLFVGPILEELIFRFFIWEGFKRFGSKTTWIVTSIIFSYSHLHAIWFVPASLQSFILYQTAYTLILGFICGYQIYRNHSITAAILTHFTFNLGFYLAALSI